MLPQQPQRTSSGQMRQEPYSSQKLFRPIASLEKARSCGLDISLVFCYSSITKYKDTEVVLMHNPPEHLATLEAFVASLEARITAIEEQLAASGGTRLRVSAMQASPSPDEDTLSTGTIQGTFSIVGSLLIGEQRSNIRVQEQVHSFFDADSEQVAQVIAAMGNPHRVTLLRALFQGPRTALQLQEELAMGSVGQLYHHLKELVATGLVIQSRRSTYSITPAKMMWISLLFMVAFHLMPPSQGDLSVTPSSNQENEAADTT